MITDEHCFELGNRSIQLNSSDMIWHVTDGSYARVYTIIQFTLGILVCIGNSLVISSVYSAKRKDRTDHMYTKSSLAVADLLSGINLVVAGLMEFNTSCLLPSFSTRYDKVVMIAQIPLQTTACYHLTYMSVRRFIAISRPYNHHPSPPGKMFFFSLTLLWVISFGQSAVFAYICAGIQTSNTATYSLSPLSITVLIVCWVTPYIVTIIASISMGIAYKCHSYSMRGSIPHIIVQQRRRDELQLTKMILFIVLGYTVDFLPIFVVCLRSIKNLCPPEVCYYTTVRNLHGTLQYVNGIVDVIIYSAMDVRYQSYITSTFRRVIQDPKLFTTISTE